MAAALISGGSNLLSGGLGMFGSSGGMSAGQRADQRFMNDFAWKQSLRQEQFQKDLATHGIRMRVADAEAAGLHPLVAAGVNPTGGAPVSVGFDGSGGPRGMNKYDRASDMVGRMGQDISRSVASTMSKNERLLQEARLATELSQRNALDAETQLKIAQAEHLRRNPPQPDADPDLPYNPVKRMGKGIGHVRDGIFGPPSYEFWKQIKRSGKRLLLLDRR